MDSHMHMPVFPYLEIRDHDFPVRFLPAVPQRNSSASDESNGIPDY